MLTGYRSLEARRQCTSSPKPAGGKQAAEGSTFLRGVCVVQYAAAPLYSILVKSTGSIIRKP